MHNTRRQVDLKKAQWGTEQSSDPVWRKRAAKLVERIAEGPMTTDEIVAWGRKTQSWYETMTRCVLSIVELESVEYDAETAVWRVKTDG